MNKMGIITVSISSFIPRANIKSQIPEKSVSYYCSPMHPTNTGKVSTRKKGRTKTPCKNCISESTSLNVWYVKLMVQPQGFRSKWRQTWQRKPFATTNRAIQLFAVIQRGLLPAMPLDFIFKYMKCNVASKISIFSQIKIISEHCLEPLNFVYRFWKGKILNFCRTKFHLIYSLWPKFTSFLNWGIGLLNYALLNKY